MFDGLGKAIELMMYFAIIGFIAAIGGAFWLLWMLINHVRFI